MIVVHATFPIDPDQRDEALELMEELAEQSREEDGVIEYEIAADIEDPNLFRFTERYEDEAALGSHSQSDHFAEFEAALPELLAGEPQATRFDIDSMSEIEL